MKRSKASMSSEIMRLQERELNILVNPNYVATCSLLLHWWCMAHYFLFNIGGTRKVPRTAGGEDGSLYNAVEK